MGKAEKDKAWTELGAACMPYVRACVVWSDANAALCECENARYYPNVRSSGLRETERES